MQKLACLKCKVIRGANTQPRPRVKVDLLLMICFFVVAVGLSLKRVRFFVFEAGVYETKDENCLTHRIMQFYI